MGVLELDEERDHSCRQQLQRSDGLRLQGQKALDELKAEFEALTRDLAADPVASWSAAPSSILSGGEPLLHALTFLPGPLEATTNMPVVTGGSGVTSSEGQQGKEPPVSQLRLANVLEK